MLIWRTKSEYQMSSSAKMQQLESLLREKGFGRALPVAEKPIYEPLPTGLPEVDRKLGGGLPRGAISEVLGPQSSGRTGIVFSALAQATQAGEVAWQAVNLIAAAGGFGLIVADLGGLSAQARRMAAAPLGAAAAGH